MHFMIFFFTKDHPRLCGEKRPFEAVVYRRAGSPPPMRGKGKLQMTINLGIRITPAYAGKRFPCCTKSAAYWDHPRLCGEKNSFAFTNMKPSGSPPPMRGKAPFSKSKPTFTGITPAYAGKRMSQVTVINRIKDHPRLCGEKSIQRALWILMMGSPPPMRGKVFDT